MSDGNEILGVRVASRQNDGGESERHLASSGPGADPDHDQGELLWKGLEVLRRRWTIIAPAAVVVFALVYGAAAMSTPVYTATSMVLINPGREQVLSREALVTDTYPTDTAVESEIQVLRSPDLMRRVVIALRLDRDPQWNRALRGATGLNTALGPLTGGANSDRATSRQSATAREALIDGIAADLKQNVRVLRQGTSFAINISASSGNSARAAELANGVAQTYLAAQTEAQFTAVQRANTYLSQRINELAADVAAKERAAEAFRVRAGLSLAAGGQEQPQSSDVQGMLAQARADLTEKEARLQQVQALIAQGGSADLIAGAANSALITELRSHEAEMTRRQSDLEQRYGELHPDVTAARVELENTRARIREEIARITTGLRNEVEISRRRLASLQGNFGSETGTFDSNSDAVIQYRQLLREAQAARTVHQSFLQRFQEVENQTALPMTTARLVSSAVAPTSPSSPDMPAAFRIALLLAVAIGVGVGFLLEMLDSSVSNAGEVERKLGATAIASVPRLRASDYRTLAPGARHPAGFLVEKPMSGFAEAFRVLRTSIAHARVDMPVRVVAITSALADEGKTTVSLCLARIAAMAGQKVLLVDCDLRLQSVASVLDASPEHGLLDVLMGNVGWRDAIADDEETSAHLLMGPPAKFTPLDLFSSQAMANLIGDLRNYYDLIVLDCAPVLSVADTRTAAARADLVMMVVRADKTPSAAARTAIKELRKAGADVHGVALNYVIPAGRGSYSNPLYYGGSSKNKYYTT